MKRYAALKTALWCVIGVFLGTSLYQIFDDRLWRDPYAMTSAPRDLSIAISGMFAIAVAATLLICMRIVKKKID